jgi:hypothetical protein
VDINFGIEELIHRALVHDLAWYCRRQSTYVYRVSHICPYICTQPPWLNWFQGPFVQVRGDVRKLHIWEAVIFAKDAALPLLRRSNEAHGVDRQDFGSILASARAALKHTSTCSPSTPSTSSTASPPSRHAKHRRLTRLGTFGRPTALERIP